MAVDKKKLDEFMGKAVGDLGAAFHAALVVIGDKLGLYKALAKAPMTSDELAQQTGDERALRPRVALEPGRRRATSSTTRRRRSSA